MDYNKEYTTAGKLLFARHTKESRVTIEDIPRYATRKCCITILVYHATTGYHYKEPATSTISQCNGIFTDQSIFGYFSREIGQSQST